MWMKGSLSTMTQFVDISRMLTDVGGRDMRPLEVAMNMTPEAVRAMGEYYARMRGENEEFFGDLGERPDEPEYPIPAGDWVSMIETVREIVAVLERGEQPNLTTDLTTKLTQIARHPSPDYKFIVDPGKGFSVIRAFHFEEALLTQAVRCLADILWMDEKVKLLRCTAAAPGRGSAVCGRFFISGGKGGRPKKYCSSVCARRQGQRERRKRANEA